MRPPVVGYNRDVTLGIGWQNQRITNTINTRGTLLQLDPKVVIHHVNVPSYNSHPSYIHCDPTASALLNAQAIGSSAHPTLSRQRHLGQRDCQPTS